MPIRAFVGSDASFALDDLKAMGDAFSSSLAKLGLNDMNDPMVEMLARRIIRAALDGERDPLRLCGDRSGGFWRGLDSSRGHANRP